jgi:threonine/homoserine/homoserine lactone efflux protein
MSWSKYAEFLAFAAVLVLIPGPDFAVVTKNTLVGGRRRGRWTALGVSSSNLVQGTAAAFGLSALIVRVQPLFEAIKWAGVAYLAYLGAQAVLSLSYLLVLVTGLHGARRLLMRRKVRRGLDATTGAVLLGFSAKLATAHV